MKKKILIISIISIIVISIVSVFVFYKVQKDNQTLEVSKLNDTSNTEEKSIEETKDENTTKEEAIENTNDIIKEETKEVNENTKEQIDKDTNDNKKQETQKKNNLGNSQSDIKQEQLKKEESQQTIQPIENTKEETKVEEPKKETVKIDLSKYDRYENALNGGYKAYKKSDSEMSKLRGLIDTCLKELGYTNVNIIASNSKLENTQYFTANKTNVENKVYNSEDFTIYYYAEAEYHITPEGAETIFQYRSYIKVK